MLLMKIAFEFYVIKLVPSMFDSFVYLLHHITYSNKKSCFQIIFLSLILASNGAGVTSNEAQKLRGDSFNGPRR